MRGNRLRRKEACIPQIHWRFIGLEHYRVASPRSWKDNSVALKNGGGKGEVRMDVENMSSSLLWRLKTLGESLENRLRSSGQAHGLGSGRKEKIQLRFWKLDTLKSPPLETPKSWLRPGKRTKLVLDEHRKSYCPALQ